MKKASAGEIAAELMELQGVASGDGVADLTVHTEDELLKLLAAQKVYVIKERHQKKRFQLGN